MDTIITKQREVFFNNLLILGLDKASTEKKYRITLEKDMFCVPNQKLFEVVTYFLFSKLNQVSNQKYSLPWPVLDKDQHRQFQKSCFNHLSAIASESNVKFPHFVASLLSTFSGDRFYELYLAFSSHILQRTIIKKNNVSLIMMPTQQNSPDVFEILRIATILTVEKFQEVQSFSLNHTKLLFKCAKKFVEQIQNFKLKLTTNYSLLEKNIHTLKTLYCDDQTEANSLKVVIKKSLKYEEKVKNLWIPFEKFLAKESELWSYVCSQVTGNQDTFCLDGSNLVNSVTSDEIKKICPELNEVSNVVGEENEKLSLHKYLKSFCILLEFYLKTTVKCELLQVNELCFRKNISSLEESVNHIKSLNENLVTNVLPSIKDSTQNLEENLLLKEFSEDLEVFLKQCPATNCCSTHFQQQTNNSRKLIVSSLPLSGEACNSSLLLGDFTNLLEDVSIESRSGSRSTAQQSDSYLANSFSVTELQQSSTLPNSEKLSDKNQNPIQERKSELNLPFDLTFSEFESNSEKLCQNLIPAISTTQILHDPELFCPSSSIEDFEIDIECKKPYKLRESWQLEDSLNAMTLPDMPELE